MSNKIPQRLTHFNLFIGSTGYGGVISELTLPKLTATTTDHLAGGMFQAMAIETGMEPMEASYTLASYEPDVFRLMGFVPGGEANLIARGSLKRGAEVTPVAVVINGIISEIDMGTWKKQEDTSLQFTVKVNYYKYQYGAENLIEIDTKNMIYKVGGVDRLAEERKAIMLP